MIKDKNKLVGYVTNQPFNEKIIPIPFQNIILRNYCKDNNLTYVLPYNETVFKNSYSQLITLINKIDNDTGIIACSIFMLPEKRELIDKIIKILNRRNTFIFFVYENLILKSFSNYTDIEYEIKMSKLNKTFFTNNKFKDYLNSLINKS